MIKVYHAHPPRFCAEGAPSNFPEGFDLVAEVDTDNIDHAWALTNHVDRPWWENKGVTKVKESRSSSVGDVLVLDDRRYQVEGIGFTEF